LRSHYTFSTCVRSFRAASHPPGQAPRSRGRGLSSASNPTASRGRPALQVTGEHREESLEPSGAPRARRARRLRTLRDVRGVGPVHQKPSEQTRERGRDGVPTTRVVRVHIGGV